MILAITDEDNQAPGSNFGPVMVGAVVVAIGMAFGPMHGYAINPARDFGPRLFTLFAAFNSRTPASATGSSGRPCWHRWSVDCSARQSMTME